MAFFVILATLGVASSLAEAQDALTPQVYCPEADRWDFGLENTTSHSGGPVSCTYNGIEGPSLCSYFPDGKFYQGPSDRCPASIAFLDFLCPSFDGIETSESPSGTAATADGNPLISSERSSDNGMSTRLCLWSYGETEDRNAGCEYSLLNGSFYDRAVQSLLPYCPPTINPAQLNSTNFKCLSNDTAGWPLIGSSATVNTIRPGLSLRTRPALALGRSMLSKLPTHLLRRCA
ncbi:hypothetical protein DFH06DRAFT_454200 [Mycena polygramma]|nr:hypothetical protein DFH06DRAFT_454200 [Mycena polygramma]